MHILFTKSLKAISSSTNVSKCLPRLIESRNSFNSISELKVGSMIALAALSLSFNDDPEHLEFFCLDSTGLVFLKVPLRIVVNELELLSAKFILESDILFFFNVITC